MILKLHKFIKNLAGNINNIKSNIKLKKKHS